MPIIFERNKIKDALNEGMLDISEFLDKGIIIFVDLKNEVFFGDLIVGPVLRVGFSFLEAF